MTMQPAPARAVEEVELSGHIIDSLLLPKVLDEIMTAGGTFEILKMAVGHRRADPSVARLRVEAASEAQLESILARITRHGAVPIHQRDCVLEIAEQDGVFPENFYVTTNEDTQVRVLGHWLAVRSGKSIRTSHSRPFCRPRLRRIQWPIDHG